MMTFDFRVCPFCSRVTAGEDRHLNCLLYALYEELVKLNHNLQGSANE